jgi:hypothetical protein
MNYDAKKIATIILDQLGGKKFIAMTGAKDFLALDGKLYGIRFAIGRNYAGVNRVEITLNESLDVYNMEFYKQSISRKTFDVSHKTVKKFEGVYCDQLQELFTSVTGMNTRL